MFNGFFKKHKQKLIWTGVAASVLGIGGGLTYYWYKKRKDETKEKAKREQQMKYLFSENSNAAKLALISVMPNIFNHLNEKYPIESLVEELKTQKDISSSRKKQVWEKIKIDSLARTISSIYALCLMDTIISIQISMIGRHLYMEHTFNNKKIEEGVEDEKLKNHLSLSSDRVSQHRFLGYAAYFNDVGLPKLISLIEQVVKAHVLDLSLKHQFATNDFKELVESVRKQIDQKLDNDEESTSEFKVQDLILPDLSQLAKDKGEENDKVQKLLFELSDLIESPEYFNVFRETCNCGFSVLYNRIEEHISKNAKRSEEVSSAPPRMHMVNVSSWLAKEFKVVMSKKEDQQDLSEWGHVYAEQTHASQFLNKYSVLIYARDLLYEQ